MSTTTNTQHKRKTWLVTGSSGGLGYHIVVQALKAGHKVLACTRDPLKQTPEIQTVKDLGGIWIAMDLASPDLENLVNSLLDRYGPIDVLVNNAGYAIGGSVEDIPYVLQTLSPSSPSLVPPTNPLLTLSSLPQNLPRRLPPPNQPPRPLHFYPLPPPLHVHPPQWHDP